MKKALIVMIALLAAVGIPGAAMGLDGIDDLKITDHGTTCTVTSDGNSVNCIGKFSGLGSTTTNIEVLAPFTCENKPGNTVVGQSGGFSGPIQPQNGQVTFNVTTESVSDKCTHADGHTVSFGPCATINIYQNNQIVFTECVPITQ
jgi:hypothetical protein